MGIGTDDPGKKLEVVGGLNLGMGDANALYMAGNQVLYSTSGQIRFPTSGVWDVLSLYSNGSERVRIDINGNVGIGTTGPSQKLHLSESEVNAGPIILLENNRASAYPFIRFWDSNENYSYAIGLDDSNNKFTIGYLAGSNATSYQNLRLVIDNTGNVGIGTTSPQGLLHIYDGAGGGSSPTSDDKFIFESDSSSYFNFIAGTDKWSGLLFSDDVRARGAVIYKHGGSGLDDSMVFYTAGSEQMVIDTSGNVGIGTTAPDEKLEVNGNILVKTGPGNSAKISMDGGNSYSLLSFLGDGTNYWDIKLDGATKDLQLREDGSNDKIRIYFQEGGNVGIGTTSPEYKLDVNGTIHGTLARMNNRNPFGDNKMYVSELNNYLFAGNSRFTVSQTGFSSWNAAQLFDDNYDTYNCRIDAAGTGIVTIDLTPDTGANGIVYPGGYIYLTFYYTYKPESISGRVMDKNSNWHNLTDAVNVATSTSYAIWRLTVPTFNYLTTIELTINAQADVASWLSQLEYHLTRPAGTSYPFLDKFSAQNLYYATTWKDTSNVAQVKLNPVGISYINGGNVGIGTTSPDAPLHVYQEAQSSARENLIRATTGESDYSMFGVGNLTNNDNRFLPLFYGFNNDDARSGLAFLGLLGASQDITGQTVGVIDYNVAKISDDNSDPLNASRSDFSTKPVLFSWRHNASSLMVIDKSGNVGIGTTSPDYSLTISQKSDADGFKIYGYDDKSNYYGEFYLDEHGYFNINAKWLSFFSVDGSQKASFESSKHKLTNNYPIVFGWSDPNNYGIGYNSSTDRLEFMHSDTMGANISMVIDDSNIGIGTTSPTAKLEVEIADADNAKGLLVDQDDVTNNPYAIEIQNAGTG
ncbi:MAG: hypothetical protein ACTSQY_10805, partial [Candidatus Odinarchaeia archaeon]